MAQAERKLQLNPNHAMYVASLAGQTGMMGECERRLEQMEKAMCLHPHYPGWYRIITCMTHYRRGEYDLAWAEARQFHTPDLPWDPITRAAAFRPDRSPGRSRRRRR